MSDHTQVLSTSCGAGHALVALPGTAIELVLRDRLVRGETELFRVDTDDCPTCNPKAPGSWDIDSPSSRGGRYAGQLVVKTDSVGAA